MNEKFDMILPYLLFDMLHYHEYWCCTVSLLSCFFCLGKKRENFFHCCLRPQYLPNKGLNCRQWACYEGMRPIVPMKRICFHCDNFPAPHLLSNTHGGQCDLDGANGCLWVPNAWGPPVWNNRSLLQHKDSDGKRTTRELLGFLNVSVQRDVLRGHI